MTSFVNRRKIRIEWGQCDPAGIVFNVRFFEYFDLATWQLFETALGVKMHDLAKTFGIIGIPLVDARAQFRKPAKFGDTIEIVSRISEFRRSSFDIEHKIYVDGELAVDGGETRVWAGKHKSDPARMAAQPIPPDVIRRFDQERAL